MQVQYVGGPVYCLALLGFKVALLTSYLRIAGVVKLYRKIIFAAIAVCVINQLIFAIIISVSCIPVSLLFLLNLRNSNQVQVAKQWDASIKGKCIDEVPFYFALAGTSIGLDLVIIVLPLPVLWKLQLRLKQKIILAALFALGFFVTVIQIFRIFTVKDLKTYTDSKNIVIWSCVEISLGVRLEPVLGLTQGTGKLTDVLGHRLVHPNLRPPIQSLCIRSQFIPQWRHVAILSTRFGPPGYQISRVSQEEQL